MHKSIFMVVKFLSRKLFRGIRHTIHNTRKNIRIICYKQHYLIAFEFYIAAIPKDKMLMV